jgi:proteasome beta subunit
MPDEHTSFGSFVEPTPDFVPQGSGATSPDAPPENRIETGTTTVALAADDGVVVAADRRASVGGGRFVSNKDTRKVAPVHPTAALALAGTVGELQSYVRTLRAEVDLETARRGEPPSLHALATLAGNLLRNGPFFASAPTLGGVDSEGAHVYDLDAGGAVLSAPYVANGSGMQLAYGVLEREYGEDLSVEAARSTAGRAVASASERDTASGNGVTLATITADGVEIDEYDDPMEVV